MNLILVGMNHKTAPVEVRECMAVATSDASRLLSEVVNHPLVSECLLLSTCNRVEALAVTRDPERAAGYLINLLARNHGSDAAALAPHFYVLHGRNAVCHLFRVSSSLDSMVLGEPQILGQVKDAYRVAVRHHASGAILNRLMHRALFVAKRVRSETGIGSAAVSISYAAVELARKIFEDLSEKKVLLIGAGEMAELAVRHLFRNGVRDMVVANRTFERALELASQFKGKAVLMEEVEQRLREVDIVISSAGARDYVITYSQVQGLMKKRKNRSLFFIDIAVPRNIDPRINELPNMYVYDIDELQHVVEYNLREREAEAVRGERIVREECIKFEKWFHTLDVVPTVKNLVDWAEGIRARELQKTIPRLGALSSEQTEVLDAMTASLVKKLLHNPVTFLKRDRRHEESTGGELALVRRLFDLNEVD